MRTRWIPALVCVLAGLTAGNAEAQSEQDYNAWLAMMSTPVGALPPLVVDDFVGDNRPSTVMLRAATWKLSDSNLRNYTYGMSFVIPFDTRATFTGTIAYFKAGGGGSGIEMAGADVQLPFLTTPTSDARFAFSAAAKASAGIGVDDGDASGKAYSLVGSLPLSVRYEVARATMITLMASPGIGLGKVSPGSSVDNGTGNRPLLAFAAALSTPSGIGGQVAVQRVPLVNVTGARSSPWVLSLSASLELRNDQTRAGEGASQVHSRH